MELEQMKTQWQEMSQQLEKQKKMTDTLIIQMTKIRYRNKLDKVWLPELAGTVVSAAVFFFILYNFHKLNSGYLIVCGIVTCLLLSVLPVFSLNMLYKIRSLNISGNNFKQSMEKYTKVRVRFLRFQKLNLIFGALMAVVALPVMTMIMTGKDVLMGSRLWLGYAIGFPFLYWFTTWVIKCYRNSIVSAENILKELEE